MASAQHQQAVVLSTTTPDASPFDKVPVELINEIVSHLDPNDLVAFASTQHFINEVCQDALDEHQFNLDYYAYVYIGERDYAGTHAVSESAIWYRHPLYLLDDLAKAPYIAYYIRTIVWDHPSALQEYETMMFQERIGHTPTKREIMDFHAKDIILSVNDNFAELTRQILINADTKSRDNKIKLVGYADPHTCLWLILFICKKIEHLRLLSEIQCDDWIKLASASGSQVLDKLRTVELWERSEWKIPARRFQNWLMLPKLERLSGDRLTEGWTDPATELPLVGSSLTCLEITSSEVEGTSIAKMLNGLDHLQSFSYVMYDENIMDSSTWDVSLVVKALVKYSRHTLTRLLLRLEVPAPRKVCADLYELEALKHFVGPASLIPHTYDAQDVLLTIDLKRAFASTLAELHLTNTKVWCHNGKTYTGNDRTHRNRVEIKNAQCITSLRQVRFSDGDLIASNAVALEELGIQFIASDPTRDRVGGEIRYFEDSNEDEEDAFDELIPSGVPEYFMKDSDSEEDEELTSSDEGKDEDDSWETESES